MARSAWADALASAYGVTTPRFIAEDSAGRFSGCCATYVAGGGSDLYSFRYGLVAEGDSVAEALLGAIRAYAVRAGITRVTVTSGIQPFAVSAPMQQKETLVLPLAANERDAWDALRNKTRNMVRRAQRGGVTVRVGGGAADVDAFYRIYVARMLARGVPIVMRAFFEEFARALAGEAELLLAEHRSVIVAGMFLCVGPRYAVYPFQVTAPGAERLAATQLLTWEAMRRCIAHGITTLDMGESSVGSPVHAAKRNFGGEPRTLAYYAFDGAPDHRSPIAEIVSAATNRAARIGMRVLPVGIGMRCGVAVKRRTRMV